MTRYKLSVVACIYRVEPYIEQACRSLFSQTLDGIEFIFIDDASPDRSVEKLWNIIHNEYPQLANDIKLVRNETNQGVSVCRQIATDMASGDYIIHFDTDDWIEPETYCEMYMKAVATDADVVICDVIEEWGNGSTKETEHVADIEKGIFKYDIISEKIHSYLWNKLVKRSLITDNGIRFMNNIGFMEDYVFMSEISLEVNKVEFVPKLFYHYRKTNDNSLTKGFSSKQLTAMLKIVPYLEGKLKNFFSDEKLRSALYCMALRFKLSILLNTRGEEQKKYSKLFPEADKYIFKNQIFGFYYKPALWLNSIGWLGGFNIIVSAVEFIKRIRK